MAGSASARAQPEPAAGPRIEVRWTAPEDCPASAFTDAMDRLLAGSTVDSTIAVEATVDHDADGWHLRTRFEAGPDRSGERTFHAPACPTIANAAALAIAIAVDPTVLDRLTAAPTQSSPPPGEDPGPEPTTAAVEPALVPEPLPEDPPLGPIEAIDAGSGAGDRIRAETGPEIRGVVAVGGLLDGVALPGPGGGIALTGGIIQGLWRAEIVGTYRFGTERASPVRADAGGRFSRWTAGVRACAVPVVGPVELPACVGADAGQTIGGGYGVPVTQVATRPWFAVLAAAGIAWPIVPRIALFARGTLAVPVLRHEFVIRGLGLVHRVGPVSVGGRLGIELRLP